MNISKIFQSCVKSVASEAKTVMKSASAIPQKMPKVLDKGLDCLANAKKILAFKGAKIGTVPNTIEALTKDAIKHGANPFEAINGAKAVVAATGNLSGKSAAESAQVFIKAGRSGFEKGFGPSVQTLSQSERKAILAQKYGKKLKAKLMENAEGQFREYFTGDKSVSEHIQAFKKLNLSNGELINWIKSGNFNKYWVD